MDKKIIALNSAGCGIDKKGFVYAQFTNGNFDLKNGVYIIDVCNEWLSALSKEDKKTIETITNKLNKQRKGK
mgnify:CR=1